MRTVTITSLLIAIMAATTGADNFAVEVIDYVSGSGLPLDPITKLSYTNPARALGPPTVDTTGDNRSTGSAADPVPVVPVYPAFRSTELVAIGRSGGKLVLRFEQPVFDDDLNPCGIDFIVFGNSPLTMDGDNYWANGDPNDTAVNGENEAEPAVVSVSADGVTWHEFVSPTADNFAPTLGRTYDPENADPSLPGNQWWGQPTDPTYPLDPGLTADSFAGQTVAQVARKYGRSAGGTGFDLRQLGVSFPNGIQYVRISNPATVGPASEIDAIAAVVPRLLPDFDCDSDVDDSDIEFFMNCTTGPGMGPPLAECKRADFDRDGDVDHVDFGFVQRCYSGPGRLVDLACTE